MKAISRIYGNIGFAGLWNGLPVRIAMVSINPFPFPSHFGFLSYRCDAYLITMADNFSVHTDRHIDSLPMAHLRQLQGVHGLPNYGWPLRNSDPNSDPDWGLISSVLLATQKEKGEKKGSPAAVHWELCMV